MSAAESFTASTAPSPAPSGQHGSTLSTFFSNFSPALAARLEEAKVAPRAAAAPWRDFFPLRSVHAFALPASRFLFPRVKSNIRRYAGNYAFIMAPFLFLFSFTRLPLFLVAALSLVLWGFVAWYRSNKLVVTGKTITLRTLTIVLVLRLFCCPFHTTAPLLRIKRVVPASSSPQSISSCRSAC